MTPRRAISFRRSLLGWYRQHGRDLPWRRTRDPYAVLVSEFMLQQTQVATVIRYYTNWLRRFPDFATLAAASESDVLHAWQGLGYYARARNLHATAKAIVEQHRGMFPDASADKLPGIGRYTANAVATFAFDAPAPVVEANVARVLARLGNLRLPIDSTAGRRALWSAAEALVPQRNAREYNSALMDLGAIICTAREPKCAACPVQRFCRARDPHRLPMKSRRQTTVSLSEDHAFATRVGKVLLEQSQTRWRGMWILPRLTPQSRCTALHVSHFPFTNHRVTLRVFARKMRRPGATHRWFTTDELQHIAIPSPHRRALAALLNSMLDVAR